MDDNRWSVRGGEESRGRNWLQSPTKQPYAEEV